MPLPDFKLEVFFSRWEFAARHHLAASDAETLRLSELLALASPADRAAWDELRLGYIETWGTPALRAAIAATYDGLDADDILCFAGAEEGIWCAMHALLTVGDHAIITVPNYQSMESIPREILGADVSGLVLRPETGWALDLDELRGLIRPNTRIVAVNFPNNPTGAMPDLPTWQGLMALCAERGITLFSDEVYVGLERNPAHRLPAAATGPGHTFSLGVLSKAYGLPGLRIGWIASRDRAALGRMERLKHYLSICNAGPSEVLGRIAIANRDAILARTNAICAENLAVLEGFFAGHADRYAFEVPPGGCVAFPKYLGADGVEAHCARLVEQAGVLLLPASSYATDLGAVPTDRFRLGFGRSGMAAGLAAWEAWLRR